MQSLRFDTFNWIDFSKSTFTDYKDWDNPADRKFKNAEELNSEVSKRSGNFE
jgi:hypothetical protein